MQPINTIQNVDLAIFQQAYGQQVTALSGSASLTLDAHGLGQLSVVTDASCSCTVSRVDTATANAHTSGVRQFTVPANTLQVTPIDWPYYYARLAEVALQAS